MHVTIVETANFNCYYILDPCFALKRREPHPDFKKHYSSNDRQTKKWLPFDPVHTFEKSVSMMETPMHNGPK